MSSSFLSRVNAPYEYKGQLPLELMSNVAGMKQHQMEQGVADAKNMYDNVLNIPSDVGYATQRKNQIVKKISDQLNELGNMDYSTPEAQYKVKKILSDPQNTSELQGIASDYYYAKDLEQELQDKRKKGIDLLPHNQQAYQELNQHRYTDASTPYTSVRRGQLFNNYDYNKDALEIGSKVKEDTTKEMQRAGLYDNTHLRSTITHNKVANAIEQTFNKPEAYNERFREFNYHLGDHSTAKKLDHYVDGSLGQINGRINEISQAIGHKKISETEKAQYKGVLDELNKSKNDILQLKAANDGGVLSEDNRRQLLFKQDVKDYANQMAGIFTKNHTEDSFDANDFAKLDYAHNLRKKENDEAQVQQDFADNPMPLVNETIDQHGFLPEGGIKLDQKGNPSIGLDKNQDSFTHFTGKINQLSQYEQVGKNGNVWRLEPSTNTFMDTGKPAKKEYVGIPQSDKIVSEQNNMLNEYINKHDDLKRMFTKNPIAAKKKAAEEINKGLNEYNTGFNNVIGKNDKDPASKNYFEGVGNDIRKNIGIRNNKLLKFNPGSGKWEEVTNETEKRTINKDANNPKAIVDYQGVMAPKNTLGMGGGDIVNINGTGSEGLYAIERNDQATVKFLKPAADVYKQQFDKNDNRPIFSGISVDGKPLYYQKVHSEITRNPNTGYAQPSTVYEAGTLEGNKFKGFGTALRPEDIEKIQQTEYNKKAGKYRQYAPEKGSNTYSAGKLGNYANETDDTE